MPTETCHSCGAPADHETRRRVPMYRPSEWPSESGGAVSPRCTDCRGRQRRRAAVVTIAAAVAVTTGAAALVYAVATADLVTLTRSGGGHLIAGTFCCLLLTVALAAWAMYALWRRLTVSRRPDVRAERRSGFGRGDAPKQE